MAWLGGGCEVQVSATAKRRPKPAVAVGEALGSSTTGSSQSRRSGCKVGLIEGTAVPDQDGVDAINVGHPRRLKEGWWYPLFSSPFQKHRPESISKLVGAGLRRESQERRQSPKVV